LVNWAVIGLERVECRGDSPDGAPGGHDDSLSTSVCVNDMLTFLCQLSVDLTLVRVEKVG
jgi:hypothetical protein